jgi:hypothetical protein
MKAANEILREHGIAPPPRAAASLVGFKVKLDRPVDRERPQRHLRHPPR